MLRFIFSLHLAIAFVNYVQPHQNPEICGVPNPLLTLQIETCDPSKRQDVDQKIKSGGSTSPLKAWKPSGLCRGVRNQRFCVYTHPSFNKGDGVSVITTKESIATIATRSAFLNDKGGGRTERDLKSLPYREVEIAGKGIGIVATRTIRAGELVIARTPGIMVNERATQTLEKKVLSELLVRAVDNLPSAHKDTLLNLSTHSDPSDYGDKIYKILTTNCFRTGYHDGVNPFYSLFAEVSRANHDCRPTCAYYFDHEDFHHKVLAVRDIMPGEEITIAYYDPLQTHSTRQDKLKKEWGFQCSCARCTADESSITESDQRVSQIHQLWKELDDHSAASEATPEKAELLVSLYEREGILGRMNEAYYRAAIEYIGVGDISNATKYANLCVEHGVLFIGSDRPFIKGMQELIADPTGHPKWKFRLRAAR
ncbi:SET domain-containing protein [Hypoxylon sp. NC1633]|nr:SET domain-containing protein [Hypoxylon sp. NC1633]